MVNPELSIYIRPFRTDEATLAAQAFAIRHEVFVEGQQVPPELEYDGLDDEATHYLATVNGRPAGAARWRSTARGIKLERFAVLEAYRGRGIGAAILQRMLEETLPLKQWIYLHAQEPAVDFYLRHGFRRIGQPFEEAGIIHFLMDLPSTAIR